MMTSSIVVFWSWQTDSPPKTNRNLILDCLERAAKHVGLSSTSILNIDRDTTGVGGTPQVAETILRKIRSADVFVWDGTLVHREPRAAPNPNVMFELGYAFAVLGAGRIVGVMNTSNGLGPQHLPFDLRHRRWPITYALDGDEGRDDYLSSRREVREVLAKQLSDALTLALKESKRGDIHADVDLDATKRLWQLVDSKWLANWHRGIMDLPQYTESADLERLRSYRELASLPENVIKDSIVKERHDAVLEAMFDYLGVAAREMIPSTGSIDRLVISIKSAREWRTDYDEIYQRQVDSIFGAADRVRTMWNLYVEELRSRFPSIVT